MKFACADYTFPLLEHEQALTVIELLDVEGVDVGIFGNRSHVRPEQVCEDLPGWTQRLGERFRSRDLEVADLFFQPWTNFERMATNHPDSKEREEAAALFRDMLLLAVGLGAGGLTLLPGIDWPDESWEDSFARSAEELAWRVDEGRAAGMRVSVEAHIGSVVDTPEKALRLVERCPGLELTLDYTHFVFQGIPEPEIEPMIEHARHFHARGARKGSLQTTLRENTIDYGRIVERMRETGYDGYLGLEYVWSPAEPPYDCTNTDNLSETVLLRDHLRGKLGG